MASAKPHFITTCGLPVRLVVVSSACDGITTTSQSAMNFSNFSTSIVRARCARMYSTAGISREERKLFGQSLGDLALQRAHLAIARDVVEGRGGFGFQQETDRCHVLLELDRGHA